MKMTDLRRKEGKRSTRKRAAAVLLAALLMLLAAVPAFAACKIDEAEYEGKGKVEVSFTSKVTYDNLKVTVKDANGKKMKVRIIDRDDDDIEFKILKYKKGETYQYKITGIKEKGTAKSTKLSGKIMLPTSNGNVPVKEIEYDKKDKEVEFSFEKKVKWKSPKVSITDGSKEYVRSIKDRDNDEIEVSVKKLKKGKVYQYTISGIKKKGDKKYTTISGTFRA